VQCACLILEVKLERRFPAGISKELPKGLLSGSRLRSHWHCAGPRVGDLELSPVDLKVQGKPAVAFHGLQREMGKPGAGVTMTVRTGRPAASLLANGAFSSYRPRGKQQGHA
jgi:hypothetical protein